MNKTIFTSLFGALLLCACDSFLSESSQDEVKPSSASDYQQILLGEAYPLTDSPLGFLDMLTDDVKNNYTESTSQQEPLQNGVSVFSWQSNMFENMKERGVNYSNPYSKYYNYIKGCNVVLDYIDNSIGTDEEKGNVKGQALAMRAYHYFILANLFGKPYNATGIDRASQPCVPLILTSDVKDELPARNSIAEVYSQIESDLLAAAPLLDAYGTGNIKDKATDQFVHHLLCRLYLYEERWEECIAEATKVLDKQPGLLQIVNYATADDNGFYKMHVYHISSGLSEW